MPLGDKPGGQGLLLADRQCGGQPRVGRVIICEYDHEPIMRHSIKVIGITSRPLSNNPGRLSALSASSAAAAAYSAPGGACHRDQGPRRAPGGLGGKDPGGQIAVPPIADDYDHDRTLELGTERKGRGDRTSR